MINVNCVQGSRWYVAHAFDNQTGAHVAHRPMQWLVFASRRTTKMQSVDTKRSFISIPSALAAVLMLGITFP
ncbi:MAG: hypothetical protein ACJ781_18335, partial [Myxococcales bacterium]